MRNISYPFSKSLSLLALLLLFGSGGMAQVAQLPLPATADDLCLIPTPQRATLQQGSLTLPDDGFANVLLLAPVAEQQQGGTNMHAKTAHDALAAAVAFLQEQTTIGLLQERILWKESKEMEKYLKAPDKQEMPCLVITLDTQQTAPSDAAIPAENMNEYYRLTIEPQQVSIHATTTQGVMMACYTLAQLYTAYGNTLPCLAIEDWPAYTWRGWMDDISRGPIPNMDFLRKASHILALYKYNYWTLYTEHTLVNPSYPDIAPKDGITQQEVAELAGWNTPGSYANAMSRTLSGSNRQHNTVYPFTTLQPMGNLQVLAHAEKTLRIPFYQEYMDTRFNYHPGQEKTYDFLSHLLSYAAANVYPYSPLFHINCDETEALGSGHARNYVSKIGADDAYCQHINRVYDILKPYHKKVLMWGDIVAKKPEMIRRLPNDMQYIVWNYAAADSYSEVLKPFKEAHDEMGIALWVAPSVAHWASMMPNANNYMANIAGLARDGYRAGARGFMNTSWDDNGEALFDNSWHGMLWGAEMAWHPLQETNPAFAPQEMKARQERFNRNFNVLFYRGSSFATLVSHSNEHYTLPQQLQGKDFAALLYSISYLENDKDIAEWCHTAALNESLYSFFPSLVDDNMATRLKRATVKLNSTEQEVLAHSDLDDHGTRNPMKHALYAVHRMQATAQKCALRRQIYLTLQSNSITDRDLCRQMAADYLTQLHKLKIEYLRLWDFESRQYSRDLIEARFDALAQEVLEMDRHIFVAVNQNKAGTARKTIVALRTLYGDREIFYTLDGRTPTHGDRLYSEPFTLEHTATLRTVAYNEYQEPVVTERYILHHKATGCKTTLRTPYSTYRDTYTGGGNNALTDGQLGSDLTYNDGRWQGYWGNDIDVEIDLGKATAVNHISMRFLQNTFDWILSPTELRLYTSTDGKKWKQVRVEHYSPEWSQGGNIVRTCALRNLKLTTRYLRIVAPNPGKLPAWHPSQGNDSYLFADEIVVE